MFRTSSFTVSSFHNFIFNLNFRLLVASQDGYLYVYQIAAVEGGDCRLVNKHDLRNFDTKELTTEPSHTQGWYNCNFYADHSHVGIP